MSDLLWWNPDWPYRKKLAFYTTVNTGGATFYDFPVMVRITTGNSDFEKFGYPNSGKDLRFIKNDNQTVLQHEVKQWISGGTGIIFTKVPTIRFAPTSGTSYIYMYYGNTGAGVTDGQDRTGVWSNNYEAVYHFAETGDGNQYLDSTKNAHNSDIISGVDRNKGSGFNNFNPSGLVFGYTPFISGTTTGCISIPDHSGFLLTNFTLEACVILSQAASGKAISLGSSSYTSVLPIITKGLAEVEAAGGDICWAIGRNSSTTLVGDFEQPLTSPVSSQNFPLIESTTSFTELKRQPKYVCYSVSGGNTAFLGITSNNNTGIFTAVTSGITGYPNTSGEQRVGIGGAFKSGSAVNEGSWDGWIGEVRISNVTRESGWLHMSQLSIVDELVGWNAEVPLFTNNFQTGNARIQNTINNYLTGNSAIATTTSNYQTGNANIVTTSSYYQTGNSRIQDSYNFYQTGNTRIQNTYEFFQTGNSRIQTNDIQSFQTGNSRIQVRSSFYQTGSATVQNAVNYYLTGNSRIQVNNVENFLTGNAKITNIGEWFQTGNSRITNSTNSYQTGNARVTVTNNFYQTGNSRIQISNSFYQTGNASIAITNSFYQTGQSRIQYSSSFYLQGNATIIPVFQGIGQLANLAEQIYRELNYPTSTTIPKISSYLFQNIGILNLTLNLNYTLNSGIMDVNETLDERDAAIFKKIFETNFYEKESRNSIGSSNSVSFVSNAGASITLTNTHEIGKNYFKLKEDAYKDLKRMVNDYTIGNTSGQLIVAYDG